MTLYAASVPVFVQILKALEGCLKKAEEHAEAKKVATDVMLGLRLTPNMFAVSRQVQVTCDFAKNTCGRLAQVDLPRFADDEKTFAEFYERIHKTIAFISNLSEAAFEGAETRAVQFPIAGKPFTMQGAAYLNSFALPNFYFHMTSTYAILRANGVDLGKRDFLGDVPGMMPA
jgi:uncharacterized protein